MAQTKLSDAQKFALKSAANHGSKGIAAFFLNKSSIKALITKGMLEEKTGEYSMYYAITAAGCEAIDTTMEDMQADYVEKRSHQIMKRYLNSVMTEKDIIELGESFEFDPEVLRAAFLEMGGKIETVETPIEAEVIEEQPAIAEQTAEIETDGVLVGEPAQEIECATCGKLFWSLDGDHVECANCDEAGAQAQSDFEFDMKLNDALIGTEKPVEPAGAKFWVSQEVTVYGKQGAINTIRGGTYRVNFIDGSYTVVGIEELTPYINPLTLEIERLRKEIAQLVDEKAALKALLDARTVREMEEDNGPTDGPDAWGDFNIDEEDSFDPWEDERYQDRGEAARGTYY